eukprot:619317-Ditylum_brightwellii.AAC.1
MVLLHQRHIAAPNANLKTNYQIANIHLVILSSFPLYFNYFIVTHSSTKIHAFGYLESTLNLEQLLRPHYLIHVLDVLVVSEDNMTMSSTDKMV